CRSAWQPNLGRRSTYRCGNSVQTTGTTSTNAFEEDGCEGDGNKACSAPAPARVQFHPWQEIWQCNDIRVTVTMRGPGFIHYDLGGKAYDVEIGEDTYAAYCFYGDPAAVAVSIASPR